MTTTSAADPALPIFGGYARGAPHPFWGGGFFAATLASTSGSAVARAPFILQHAYGEASRALTLEAKWRASYRHARMPTVAAMGSIAASAHEQENSFVVYEGVAAVPLERAIGVHAIPVVLAWAQELVDVMRHHAACSPATPMLRANFSDLLVTRDGALLVLTIPAVARTWHTTWLRSSRQDHAFRPPRGQSGEGGAHDVVHEDIFAAGALVRLLLRERNAAPRQDITARIASLVTRAMKPTDEARFESLDELAHELRACTDEFPALEATERAAAVAHLAGLFDEVEQSFP